MDPYAAAGWLSFLRIPFTIMMLLYISRTKIRQLYVMTSTLVWLGSLTVASRLYFGIDAKTEILGETVASWMPVAGLTMMYAGEMEKKKH